MHNPKLPNMRSVLLLTVWMTLPLDNEVTSNCHENGRMNLSGTGWSLIWGAWCSLTYSACCSIMPKSMVGRAVKHT